MESEWKKSPLGRYKEVELRLKDSGDGKLDFSHLLREAAVGDLEYELGELASAGACCHRDFEARQFLKGLAAYYCETKPCSSDERPPTEEEIDSVLRWLMKTTMRGVLYDLKTSSKREIAEHANHQLGYLKVHRDERDRVARAE